MRIATNVLSMMGQRSLKNTVEEKQKASMKLSSGDRIYTAATDPAGLAISEKLRAKSAGISQAKRNANDTISLLQVAEGNLAVVHEISTRLKELAVQAASDTLSEADRLIANKEFQSLKTEVRRIQESVSYNGRRLKDNEGSFSMQVGVNNSGNDRISFNMRKALRSLDQLGISGVSISSKGGAQVAIGRVDQMIEKISSSRAELGSLGNRMESTINNLMIAKESSEAAKSQIRDTDMAQETSKSASLSIREQATTALLTNANKLSGNVMRLLT